MEYNTALFGEKRTIYNFNNDVYTRLFEIGSQNISVEQGFNSGDFTMNAELPADLALWEIGEDSVLTRLTWRKKDSDNNRITHHSVNKERVKMMLATNGARINTTTYDVSTSGSLYYDTIQCNYRNIVSQSNFNPVQTYPLWNPLVGVTGYAPHFSVLPFILDFDYAGVLLKVRVRTFANIDYDLKDFIDNHNGNTTIAAVYVVPYFGTATNHIIPTSTRFENGTSIINITGMHLVNTKSYDLPTNLKPELNIYINDFIMGSKLATQYNLTGNSAWTIMDYTTSATSYRASYYQDDEVWDENGLIPHGENNEYNQDDIDYILKQIALLGFWFTTDSTNINTRVTGENCTDPSTYLPEIKDGITTGNYWAGTEAAAQDAAKWGDDWREKVNYDPSGGGGGGDKPKPTPDPNPIQLQTPGFSLAVDNGSVCYTIDKAEWHRIWEDIYSNKKHWKDIVEGLSLYGANPLNAILNYRWYPFEIAGTTQQPIRLGATIVKPESHTYLIIDNTASALISSNIAEFWIGEYSNFMWTKKTKCRIFLPFYGYYELPMSQVMAKTVGIQFQYNLPDDTGVWAIYFDGHIYDYVECSPFIEIPITGDNSLQIAAAKAQRNLQIALTVGAAAATAGIGFAVAAPAIASIGAAAAESAWAFGGSSVAAGLANIGPLMGEGLLPAAQIGAAIGGAGAITNGGVKIANTVMQSALQIGNLSTNVPIHSSGSDTTFLHLPMQPFIEFFTNNTIEGFNESEYKLKTGIACDMWKTTSAMPDDTLLAATGIADMDTSGMTLAEIQELNQILQSGFYK